MTAGLLGYETALSRRCPDCGNSVVVESETGEAFHDQVECPYCELEELKILHQELEKEAKDLRARVAWLQALTAPPGPPSAPAAGA